MGIGSFLVRKSRGLRSVARVAGGVVGKVARSPIGKIGLKFAGPVGAAYTAYDIAKSAMGKGGGHGGLSMPPMNLPSLGITKRTPGRNEIITKGTAGPGILPRGPGGKLQLPWNDPNTPEFLKGFSLDDSYLRTYYRAPAGFVVVRDATGKPYPMMKWAARRFGLWTPGKKPPISVGEHQAIRRADRAVKKIRRVMTQVSRVDRAVSHGKVKIFKKRGK